jgi:proteasome lid subunit RPN8/RPN11
VIEKLHDVNGSNDYLANVVSQDYWDAESALMGSDQSSYPYPTTDELPAIRTAFDGLFSTIETKKTDSGIMLYEPEVAYEHIEVSLGGREKAEKAKDRLIRDMVRSRQKTYGPDSSQLDLFYGDPDPDEGTIEVNGHTIRRNAIVADFQEQGFIDFVGQRVNTPADVADLFAIHRSPYIEKFHMIFTDDDGNIVFNATITSNAATYVVVEPSMVVDILGKAFEAGATKAYMLHNHPSGRHQPSESDRRLTKAHAAIYAEYSKANHPDKKPIELVGHIVVNTSHFSFIDTSGSSVEMRYKNPVRVLAQKPGLLLNNPDTVGEVAKAILKGGYDTAIMYVSAGLDVNGYEPVFSMSPYKIVEQAEASVAKYGASGYMIVTNDPAVGTQIHGTTKAYDVVILMPGGKIQSQYQRRVIEYKDSSSSAKNSVMLGQTAREEQAGYGASDRNSSGNASAMKIPASVERANAKFNIELEEWIAGNMPKNHTFRLGKPSDLLKAAGFPDMPIELRADKLDETSLPGSGNSWSTDCTTKSYCRVFVWR